MWPRSLVVGIGDTAVCVGTDDAQLVSYLDRWRIEEQAGLIDYGLQLAPPAPDRRSDPRPLPSLRHGSSVIAASSDHALLTDALLRILGGFETAMSGDVRLRCVPIVNAATIDLVPVKLVRHLSTRWMKSNGLRPIFVDSVVVDSERLDVTIAPPLGAGDDVIVMPLGQWMVATGGVAEPESLAQRVARTASTVDGMSGAGAADVLDAFARLHRQLPPVSVPDAAALRAALSDRNRTVRTRQVIRR